MHCAARSPLDSLIWTLPNKEILYANNNENVSMNSEIAKIRPTTNMNVNGRQSLANKNRRLQVRLVL